MTADALEIRASGQAVNSPTSPKAATELMNLYRTIMEVTAINKAREATCNKR